MHRPYLHYLHNCIRTSLMEWNRYVFNLVCLCLLCIPPSWATINKLFSFRQTDEHKVRLDQPTSSGASFSAFSHCILNENCTWWHLTSKPICELGSSTPAILQEKMLMLGRITAVKSQHDCFVHRRKRPGFFFLSQMTVPDERSSELVNKHLYYFSSAIDYSKSAGVMVDVCLRGHRRCARWQVVCIHGHIQRVLCN